MENIEEDNKEASDMLSVCNICNCYMTSRDAIVQYADKLKESYGGSKGSVDWVEIYTGDTSIYKYTT